MEFLLDFGCSASNSTFYVIDENQFKRLQEWLLDQPCCSQVFRIESEKLMVSNDRLQSRSSQPTIQSLLEVRMRHTQADELMEFRSFHSIKWTAAASVTVLLFVHRLSVSQRKHMWRVLNREFVRSHTGIIQKFKQ